MHKINDLVESYKQKIDEIVKANLNNDQKDLIKDILDTIAKKENVTEELIQNVYQLLIQRVKVGFTFDAAPTSKVDTVAYLQKDEKLSFGESDSNQNTLIIGENYDALKCLLLIEGERERERANAYYDVVYIDPPYNTESSAKDGNNIANDNENVSNNKFIYRDKFSRNGWLNMMNERLQLAKQLLKEDGVIFVSIDDNEQAYLKILMDEIFGEENFIANFIFARMAGPKSNTKLISTNHEYVVCYAKNISLVKINLDERNEEQLAEYKNKDNDPRGPWARRQLLSIQYNENKNFEIEFENKIYKPPIGKSWLYSKEKMITLIKDKRIYSEGKMLREKRFLSETRDGITPISIIYDNKLNNGIDNNWDTCFFDIFSKKYLNTLLIDKEKHGNSQNGTEVLFKILNNRSFNFPKSLTLLSYLINIFANKNARVLDFFAGSGTTGHAVLELNKRDGGNRSFTLVTNNENNIAKDITYERLYRINKGVGTKGENFDWTKNNLTFNSNLSVFDIKHLNIGLKNKNLVTQLLKNVQQMLEDFGVNNKIESIENILSKLRSLKPLNE
ncbi:Type III restriction-modification system:methylase [Mycoplasmopsis columbina SF7]|uniref:Type III restriction-modification system:methylase n=1 Tax=Mycoplasmopsis columbina SF7 TaxID=1037410 RepID=F9UJB7_9BACT|nr:site-specific DNA-methyltransferase [Mycoplasmopsis columbina]EGV00460.1 Type III restriction-modification system:methylase [Mycoplasmopsis columbina SF7]